MGITRQPKNGVSWPPPTYPNRYKYPETPININASRNHFQATYHSASPSWQNYLINAQRPTNGHSSSSNAIQKQSKRATKTERTAQPGNEDPWSPVTYPQKRLCSDSGLIINANRNLFQATYHTVPPTWHYYYNKKGSPSFTSYLQQHPSTYERNNYHRIRRSEQKLDLNFSSLQFPSYVKPHLNSQMVSNDAIMNEQPNGYDFIVYNPSQYSQDRSHPTINFTNSQLFSNNNLQQPTQVDHQSNIVSEAANSFVNVYCPFLGEKPYCLPPVKRNSLSPYNFSFRLTEVGTYSVLHLLADKQLVLGMESEKRVLGSFECFFAENQTPVFMLCHYPVSGFMHIYNGNVEQQDGDSYRGNSNKDTLTLLLLSATFSVTIVKVNALSSNSEFDYIRKNVQRAVSQMKRCRAIVAQWLTFLGVSLEMREIIAFPNLKSTMMKRITKDKENFGSLCTLNVDELPAPFEDEWSNLAVKRSFSRWMKENVLCHAPTLTREELRLVVGAFLSPRLSKVDFVQENSIEPLSEARSHEITQNQPIENVGQLQITIDGVTKSFDEFMVCYVNEYYPDVENKTYRVPPIHFNIQSLKKFSDLKGSLGQQVAAGSIHKTAFMPQYKSHQMAVSTNNEESLSSLQPKPFLEEALKDIDVLCDVMDKDVRADEGENRVISALEHLGHNFGPMFLICGYQYNNYLNKLREEMFPRDVALRPTRAFGQTMRAEHDCLIFHKKYGAIVVCIKAVGDNFEEWNASEEQKTECIAKIIDKAVKQLEREESMIRHVTSDLHVDLACHKMIALPNLTRENVISALSGYDQLQKKTMSTLGHKAFFLCSDELPPKYEDVWDESQNKHHTLFSWWKKVQNILDGKKNTEIKPQMYEQLIGRYCGFLSTVEVWSPSSPRVEVRSSSEAVSVCAQRFRKLVLLPEQIKILCSNERRVFLHGPPGSGKTLVLTLKAREWLLAGETVILVNSRVGSVNGFPYAYGVIKKLEQMLKGSNVNMKKLFMLNIDSLKFLADRFSYLMPSSCFIMDEVTPASDQIIEHLSCLQVRNIWCAGLFEDDRPITAHPFCTYKLCKILRCPPIVQSLLKHTERNVREKTPYMNNYHSSVLKDTFKIQKNGSSCQGGDRNYVEEKPKSDKNKVKNIVAVEENMSIKNLQHDTCEEYSQSDSQALNTRLSDKYQHLNKTIPNPLKALDILPNLAVKKMILHIELVDTVSKLLDTVSKSDPVSDLEDGEGNDEQNLADNINTKASKLPSELLAARLNKKYGMKPKAADKIALASEEYSSNQTLQSLLDGMQDIKWFDPESLDKRLKEKFVKKLDGAVDFVSEKSLPEYNTKVSSNTIQEKLSEAEQTASKEIQIDASKSDKNNKYDADSVNERLHRKYGKESEMMEKNHRESECKFATAYKTRLEITLPTNGPRPLIIDHSTHKRSRIPSDCYECGLRLAEFLFHTIKLDYKSEVPSSGNQEGKTNNRGNNRTTRGRGQSKKAENILFSNSPVNHMKSAAFLSDKRHVSCFGSNDLTWSDVLIVAREMPKDCKFVKTLRDKNIPVEVLMSGKTSEIETTEERKLFITSYKEVTGLERAVIVFVPSENPNEQLEENVKDESLDLQLGHTITRFTEEDRIALWYVASRSLASLVLIVP